MSSAFTIKSVRVDTLSVVLKTVDISAIREGLEKSFSNIDDAGIMPFLLDVHSLENPWDIDIKEILQQFEDLHLRVIGVRHTDKNYAAKVAQYGLAFSILPSDNDNQETQDNLDEEDSEEVSQSDNNESEIKPTLIIDKPVRSGQQIYARGSDIICTAAINQGAEVIADGNIHIYAPLRGRALAGASGNQNARIFVYSMQAQLVSIAGIYRIFDKQLPPSLYRNAVCVSLDGEKLNITALNSN